MSTYKASPDERASQTGALFVKMARQRLSTDPERIHALGGALIVVAQDARLDPVAFVRTLIVAGDSMGYDIAAAMVAEIERVRAARAEGVRLDGDGWAIERSRDGRVTMFGPCLTEGCARQVNVSSGDLHCAPCQRRIDQKWPSDTKGTP